MSDIINNQETIEVVESALAEYQSIHSYDKSLFFSGYDNDFIKAYNLLRKLTNDWKILAKWKDTYSAACDGMIEEDIPADDFSYEEYLFSLNEGDGAACPSPSIKKAI